jgi:hypothetical protein
VLNVLAASFAIFADVEPFRIISLVFHGCVIASFAITASQGDDDSVVFFSHDTFSWAVSKKKTDKNGPWRGVKLQYIQVFQNLSTKLKCVDDKCLR